MVGTLFSILIGIFLYIYPIEIKESVDTTFLAITMFLVATLFIMTQTAITLFAWAPLQRSEQTLTPRVVSIFKKDVNLKVTNLFLLVFLFFTYLSIIEILFFDQFNKQYILIIWTILLGIAVDLLHHHLMRVLEFLDPFHVVEFFSQSAKGCVVLANETELCDWIDTLSETSVKAVSQNSTSLALTSLDKLRLITKNYLEIAKGITYHADEDETQFGGADHVSYMLFYFFHRIELIFEKALKGRVELICSKIITMLGKICIYGAKYDITIAAYPLYYLGKLTSKAQKEGMQEVGNRASLTLTEVSKVIVEEVDLQYLEIKDTFLGIIDNLDQIANDTFRNDKSVNIQLLTQPFYELKNLFQNEMLSQHQDTPSILQNIDAVLGKFDTLATVMSTMPPVSQMDQEREEVEEEPEEAEEEE